MNDLGVRKFSSENVTGYWAGRPLGKVRVTAVEFIIGA